ncbi:unnamed protein product [Discula destructiva]
MDSPEEQIRGVVRSLCQGTPDEQRRTLAQYFTKDASFIHPFCIVPHFRERRVPVLGSISSRDVVRSIFQWYRMLSPKIEIEIDSVLYDHARDKLYLDMRQIFSVWFIPLYRAPVRLVTVLDLVSTDDRKYYEPLSRLVEQDAPEEKKELQQQTSTSPLGGSKTWKISKQEDLYQVNEFLKFTGTTLLASAWFLFQLGATAVCIFMSLFLRLSPWARQMEPARGGVESAIEQFDGSHRDSEAESSGVGESKAQGKKVAEEKDYQGSDDTNGKRSTSAHSKASHPPYPKKDWKHSKKASR